VRLFGVIVLAGLLSGVVALGVTAAGIQFVQCRSDPAGCGMAAAFQVLAIPVYTVVLMIVFGLVMMFADRLRAIAVTASILVGITVLLFFIGILSDSITGRQTKPDDLLELLQLLMPYWVAVAVQWFVIRFYLMRRMANEVAS
jgi:hypothetical protein